MGTLLQHLTGQRCVAVQDGSAIKVNNRRVISDWHVGYERVEQVVQIGVRFERALNCSSHRSSVVNVDTSTGKIRDRINRGISDLLCEELRDCRGIIHPLSQGL